MKGFDAIAGDIEVVMDPSDGAGDPERLCGTAGDGTAVVYFVFDVLVLRGRSAMHEPLSVRRDLLKQHVWPTLTP